MNIYCTAECLRSLDLFFTMQAKGMRPDCYKVGCTGFGKTAVGTYVDSSQCRYADSRYNASKGNDWAQVCVVIIWAALLIF
jgi:hypothetical protein